MNTPVFLSEFGMWLNGTGRTDAARMMGGVYQAMEISDGQQTTKTRYVDFYNPIVSGTEWHWDYYYNKHNEYMNGNQSKLITTQDAWNEEDYSVVGYDGTVFNMDNHVIQRAYPRRVQGSIMSFYYNTIGTDYSNNVFSWGAIKPNPIDTEPAYFGDKRFAILIWSGKKSDAPTEVFLPPHFSPQDVILITDKRIYNKGIPNAVQNKSGEAIIIEDRERESGSGNLLIVWDDHVEGEDPDSSIHFLIAVCAGNEYTYSLLADIQKDLRNRILWDKKSPVYLTGTMTYDSYPAE
jgi:hypothetical protein